MKLDNDTSAGIGTALNEATLLGVEYDPQRNIVGTTFAVLTLPNDPSPEPSDPRRQIILTNVGRIAAALRDSRWDDYDAIPIRFAHDELLAIVQSFGGQPVYGWECVNTQDSAFQQWQDRLSLDFTPADGSFDNTLALFQEGAIENRHLDIWLWFEDLLIRDAEGDPIEMSDFIAGGRRWWDALHNGDPRTDNHGIIPGGADS